MDTRRSFGRLFNRIAAAARRWAAQLHPRPAEATIPPLQPARLLAKAEPIPADPAEHAVQFAEDWYDRLEFHSRRRMRELGIPEHRIGAYDIDYDFRHAAFHPKERTGGSNFRGAHQPQQRPWDRARRHSHARADKASGTDFGQIRGRKPFSVRDTFS
jgi:hypothetical protein